MRTHKPKTARMHFESARNAVRTAQREDLNTPTEQAAANAIVSELESWRKILDALIEGVHERQDANNGPLSTQVYMPHLLD